MPSSTPRALLLLAVLTISMQAPFVGGAAADPVCDLNIFGPAICPIMPEGVNTGALGVVDDAPYAMAEGGLVVTQGSRVTFVADFKFDQNGIAPGQTYLFVAHLRILGPYGQLGSDVVSRTTQASSFFEVGTLEVGLSVPESFRSGSVVLETQVWRNGPNGNMLLGTATSTAPLTTAAVPDAVVFLTEDLQVGDAFHAGVIDFTGTNREVSASDGVTFVSTELGTLVRATATVDRPQMDGQSSLFHHVSVSLGVQLEGGVSVGVWRMVYASSCSDWATHACAFAEESRVVDLEVVVSTSALSARSVANVYLSGNIDLSAYNAPSGQDMSEWTMAGDQGRHVLVAAGV